MEKFKDIISIKIAPFIVAALIAISLGLNGCVGIPLPAKSEVSRINKHELWPFKLGVTTRKHVEVTLGKPDLIRLNNKLWIYGWSQHHGKLAGVFLLPGGIVPFHSPLYLSNHALFVEFDAKGVLKGVELKEGERPCRDDGICVLGWVDKSNTDDLFLALKLRFDEFESIVTAPEHEDQLAKDFLVTDEVCGFYLFTSFKPLLPVRDESEIWFSISELENQSLHYDTYAFLMLTPGKKELLVQRKDQYVPNVRKSEPGVILKEFDCQAGKNIYLRIDYNEWAWNPILTVSIDDSSLAQQKIKDKKLLLFELNQDAAQWGQVRGQICQ
jgi:hypothetical protein